MRGYCLRPLIVQTWNQAQMLRISPCRSMGYIEKGDRQSIALLLARPSPALPVTELRYRHWPSAPITARFVGFACSRDHDFRGNVDKSSLRCREQLAQDFGRSNHLFLSGCDSCVLKNARPMVHPPGTRPRRCSHSHRHGSFFGFPFPIVRWPVREKYMDPRRDHQKLKARDGQSLTFPTAGMPNRLLGRHPGSGKSRAGPTSRDALSSGTGCF